MPRTQLQARDFDPVFDRLTEVTGFGSNPGALRMFEYVPTDPEPALVVVLHGCTQTAASYDFGAGWPTLADRHGFVLLLPEQQPANNAKNCFNWFLAGDIERGRGEAMSIRQMGEKMIVDHGIDRRRVFVTGLSAGGAMTSVMLATYPDVFAAGASPSETQRKLIGLLIARTSDAYFNKASNGTKFVGSRTATAFFNILKTRCCSGDDDTKSS
jgi:poly(hydroxyalkanoate) depolymerase family esterase